MAFGRKNSLFAGADAGGECAAAIYSLIRSAELNGFYPEAYPRHVIGRIADHPVSRVGEHLPWAVPQELSPVENRAAAGLKRPQGQDGSGRTLTAKDGLERQHVQHGNKLIDIHTDSLSTQETKRQRLR